MIRVRFNYEEMSIELSLKIPLAEASTRSKLIEHLKQHYTQNKPVEPSFETPSVINWKD